jgi:type IV fimbrial biogenesis protein FimT
MEESSREAMRKSFQSGFTVLELMIVIALMAMLAVIGIPSLRDAIQNNRVTAQTNNLITAFQLARSEAVKRGQPVTICASNVIEAEDDGNDPICADDWSQGWMVVVDGPASAGAGTVTLNERIRAWRPTSDDVEVTETPDTDFLRFLPRGNVDGASGFALPLEFELRIDGCTGDRARDVEISLSGTVSSQRAACS